MIAKLARERAGELVKLAEELEGVGMGMRSAGAWEVKGMVDIGALGDGVSHRAEEC